MPMLMHIHWNKQSLTKWKETRQNGKRKYVIKSGLGLFSVYVLGISVFGTILNSTQGRFEGSHFWFWLAAFLLIGLVTVFGTLSWKWDQTESSYVQHIN